MGRDGEARYDTLQAYVPPSSPSPLLLAFSPSFSASDDVLEPRLRTCDNETMAGLTECEYIYILRLITSTTLVSRCP